MKYKTKPDIKEAIQFTGIKSFYASEDCADYLIDMIASVKELKEENEKLKNKLNVAKEALEFCVQDDLFTSNGQYEEMFKYNYKEWFGDVAKKALEEILK